MQETCKIFGKADGVGWSPTILLQHQKEYNTDNNEQAQRIQSKQSATKNWKLKEKKKETKTTKGCLK
jgi:hypothetical protein